MDDLAFVLLHLSALTTGITLFMIVGMRRKREIHIISIGLIASIFCWCTGMLAESYAISLFHYEGMFFTNIYFTAVGFVSVYVYLLGRSFSAGENINRLNYLTFIFPILNMAAIWTNDYHHLYFKNYSLINSELQSGPLHYLQSLYAYPLILIGLFYLIFFSIKNAGFFSKQSILITCGIIVPLTVDLAFVTKIATFSMYFEPISFTVAAICFALAIIKYDFLNVLPIAVQTIVDHISDSYLVLNSDRDIVDYNKAFISHFSGFIDVKRKTAIWTFFEQIEKYSPDRLEALKSAFIQAEMDKKSAFCEEQMQYKDTEIIFSIEITPIMKEKRYDGMIILIKDITELKKSFELVKHTQTQLIEREHLASLGQMVGGIAHNLKTPIMSVSGAVEGLMDLIREIDDSVDDPQVDREDYHEITREMRGWTEKINQYCAYMSDIISTVKGQAVQLTASTTDQFEINELLKRIDILMNHELKKYGCKLNVVCEMEKSTMIKGEVNSLVQIVNNLINNAVEAYEGREGTVDLILAGKAGKLLLSVRDYGCGMKEEVKSKLFKEMITTKAKQGTGLGLYMSYSNIVGKFDGEMWFESEEGSGTTFYILIPFE